MKTLTRRSVTTGLAAAVTAIPAVGLSNGLETGAGAERHAGVALGLEFKLNRLIQQHRAAYAAFSSAVEREETAKELLRKGEPVIKCYASGSSFCLYLGQDECRSLVANEYRSIRRKLRSLQRIVPDQAAEALAILDAKEAENIADVDRAFADYNAVEADCRAADATEHEAFTAICSYQRRNPEEVRIKAEYLLTTSIVKDTWHDEARAILRSLIGEQS